MLSKKAIRKLLGLINESRKGAGYKINTQKSLAFLYTNNEKSEREMKETTPRTTPMRRIKYTQQGIRVGPDPPSPSSAVSASPFSNSASLFLPLGFPGGPSGKESACNVGDPRVGKTPWRRERLPTPVFWPAEFHGLYSPWGCKESDTTE